MAAHKYTVIGQAEVWAESCEDAEDVAFNSEVEWKVVARQGRKRALWAFIAGVGLPSPFWLVPKALLAAGVIVA